MNSEIFYQEAGSGQPVVFIHGYCETHKIWDAFIPKLVHSFRIISPDLPGFGKSPLPDGIFSLGDIACNLHDLLVEIRAENPILIGHSLGGYISLAYVKKYPSEVKGFGLFHSNALEDTPEKKENRTKLIGLIDKNGSIPFIRSFIPSLFYEKRNEELSEIIARLTEESAATPAPSIKEYARAMRDRENNIKILQEFPKPVMMIIGENDTSVPLDRSLEQSRLIQRPYILQLKETAHMGMFERPVETFNFLYNFLNVC